MLRSSLLIILGASMLIGCASRTPEAPLAEFNYSLSAFFNPQVINTLVVMPLENQTSAKGIEESVREELILQLIKTDRYTVVDRYLLRELLETQGLTGYELDSRLVKRIQSQFGADAIVLGKVTQYFPGAIQWHFLKKPPVLGLSLRMVSTQTGQTLWTIHDLFSGGDDLLCSRAEVTVRERLSTDIAALTQTACTEVARTLNF